MPAIACHADLCFPHCLVSLPIICCMTNSSFSGHGRVLISMKAKMYDPNHLLDSWKTSDPMTHYSWVGIRCDNVGRVMALDVSNMSLSDLFPNVSPEIGNCSALKSIDLSQNEFRGAMPAEISKLSKLSYLNVSRNNLNEIIPTKV